MIDQIKIRMSNPVFYISFSTRKHIIGHYDFMTYDKKKWDKNRVSVQGVKSLGGHFACLCRGFDFYEVKKKYFLGLLFFKKKREILLHF